MTIFSPPSLSLNYNCAFGCTSDGGVSGSTRALAAGFGFENLAPAFFLAAWLAPLPGWTFTWDLASLRFVLDVAGDLAWAGLEAFDPALMAMPGAAGGAY